MAKEIATANAPAAVGPYSQALAVGPFVFASGQIPLNPSTGTIVGETAAEQAEQVFTNIEAVLKEAGLEKSMIDELRCLNGNLKISLGLPQMKREVL